MTPIESREDIRLATLIGVAINAIESLSLATDVNPEQLLAEYLYLTNKRIHEIGHEGYLNKLWQQYHILDDAIS